jgi:hypothetical protein
MGVDRQVGAIPVTMIPVKATDTKDSVYLPYEITDFPSIPEFVPE